MGDIRFVVEDKSPAELLAIRRQAEAIGGALVITRAPVDSSEDPWGTPPETVALQRRVKAAFDPIGIANPGILPGGI